jgi:hypothetical protein
MEAGQPLCSVVCAAARARRCEARLDGDWQEPALAAAVAAAVRHRHTNYDELLAGGMDSSSARQKVADRLHEILEDWRQ